ncbi:MAG: Fe-S-containing hydro-lyase [Atopobiaceae bacterium]|nr:Fe-S-containing hydro-lyase [Atopobiaceae bacterium]
MSVSAPLSREAAAALRAGDSVLLSGIVHTARDAAHKRIHEALAADEDAPFPLEDAVIYYAGPAPARPGEPIGPVGPTTSYRMDPYAPELLDRGVRAMIGKGKRNEAVIEAIKRNGGIYFGAVGGAAALIARCVKSAETIAFEDLGAEAIRRLEVVDLPLTVVIDSLGNNLYESGPAAYRVMRDAGAVNG